MTVVANVGQAVAVVVDTVCHVGKAVTTVVGPQAGYSGGLMQFAVCAQVAWSLNGFDHCRNIASSKKYVIFSLVDSCICNMQYQLSCPV